MPRTGNGTVFLVGNTERGLYRLGWTAGHLNIRISQMHRDNVFPIMEVASAWVKDAPQVEEHLKQVFDLKRVLGGWYLLDSADIKLARRFLGLDLF